MELVVMETNILAGVEKIEKAWKIEGKSHLKGCNEAFCTQLNAPSRFTRR